MKNRWEYITFQDICYSIEKLKKNSSFKSSFYYVDISSINSDKHQIENPNLIELLKAPSRAKQIIQTDDILVSTVRPKLRRIARVQNSLDNTIASTGFSVLRIHKSLNSTFFFYFCISDSFVESLVKLQKGASYPAVRNSDVLSQGVPVPPLAEQNRIVEKLNKLFGHLDALKERLDRIPQLLKDFRRSVLSQAVSGKLTEGTRNEKWRTVKLKDLVIEIKSGKSFSCPEIPVVSGKIGLVKISAVTWGEFDEKETKTVEDPDRIRPDYFIKKGDFLMSRANTLEKVGASVIVKKIVNKIMLSDKVWRVKFAEECDKKYINYFLRSDIGRREIESRASGNQVSMRNLSQSKFLDIGIRLPSLSEQKQIVLKIESLFVKADKIKQYNIVLKEKINVLPQAILEKAFKGELVPQLKGDGSAEDLLKQIQVSKELENKKVVEKIKKKIKPVKIKMKDLIEIIELNFKSKYFTFEDIDQHISNISKAEYVKIKNEFFELLKKDKFSIEGEKLKSKLVKSKGVIQYKLESK